MKSSKSVRIATLWVLGLCCLFAGYHVVVAGGMIPIDLNSRFAAPGRLFWLGSDELGRSQIYRLLDAGQSTLLIAAGATIFDVALGTAIALVAAYRGGWIDHALSALIDFFWSIPLVIFVVLVTSIVGVGVWSLILTIAGTNWVNAARILRAEARRLAVAPFVRSSRATGFNDGTILLRTILPNMRELILAVTAYTVIEVMTLETGLAFFGLSLPAPHPSWGGLLAESSAYIRNAWWLAASTSAFIIATLASVTVFARAAEHGDGEH